MVPALDRTGIFLMQTWQKVAPVTLLTYCLAQTAAVSVLNVLSGAVIIIRITTPILVILFSGIMNLGWIFQLGSRLLWGFLLIYFLIMIPIVKYIDSRTSDFALRLLNVGGLPPFTGFV